MTKNRKQRRFEHRCARKIKAFWDKIITRFHKDLFSDGCRDFIFKRYNDWWIHGCRWLGINRPNDPVKPNPRAFYEYAINKECNYPVPIMQ